MRKGIVKLVFVLGVAAGGVLGGLSQTEAEAAPLCSGYCLDAECTCFIRCFRAGGGCICEDHCSIE
ncbi:hypothetical protein [Stigmatella aurantiaca]|uniref:Uncharacterized protein n=1 Tax=Stigmatella aurantiaca (strain DW4/3-1) TaxID=378806 RepID=E3FUL7_STIAD|nr:hypothetical protein [Stigmatella aurantiaca]ADO74715.1 uncharacterized protein STAUR_6959 [Stigmatella aurantiaca DW4/3-1]